MNWSFALGCIWYGLLQFLWGCQETYIAAIGENSTYQLVKDTLVQPSLF